MFEKLQLLSPVADGVDYGNAISEANRDLSNAQMKFTILQPCVVKGVICYSNNAATAAGTMQFTSYVDGSVGTLGDCGEVTIPASASANIKYVDWVPSTSPQLKVGSMVLMHVSDAGDSGDNVFCRLLVDSSPCLELDSSYAVLSS